MYVGRFAPTTSGPLHLGSLITAVASYLEARSNNGLWLLRLDDIDVPRNVSDGRDIVLRTLEAHHLEWDGPIRYQTDNQEQYQQAIDQLDQQELLFYCTCTRSELRHHRVYPGTCRHRRKPPQEPATLRVLVGDEIHCFKDRIQGTVRGNLNECVGDFSVRRKENIVSYPLAVVVDDYVNEVTDVVRGADLVDNTLAQLYLIKKLGYQTPTYAHIPILNQQGEVKLSKRNQAVAIDNRFPLLNISTSLQLLGLNPPVDLDIKPLLDWAIESWNTDLVPKQRHLNNFISI